MPLCRAGGSSFVGVAECQAVAAYAWRVHEVSICTAIAKIAHKAAAGRHVERVRVDVGHLRQVVPDTLVYCWEMVVFGTPLEGAPLEVREIPAVIECRVCRASTRLDEPLFVCGGCGSSETNVVSGNELFVTSLDIGADESEPSPDPLSAAQ